MSSLQDKYLPNAQFKTSNEVRIKAGPDKIFPYLLDLDFSDATITYWLFRLRGIPVPEGMTMQGLHDTGFYVLESRKNEAIILGLIGQFWTPNGQLQTFEPHQFSAFKDPDFAKATWEFRIHSVGEMSVLQTETRIHCLSDKTRRKFQFYWWVVKPFSSFTRYEILRSIKKKAER